MIKRTALRQLDDRVVAVNGADLPVDVFCALVKEAAGLVEKVDADPWRDATIRNATSEDGLGEGAWFVIGVKR